MSTALFSFFNAFTENTLVKAIFRSPVFRCGRQGLHDHHKVGHILVKNNIYEISIEHPYLIQDDANIWQMALRSVRQDGTDGATARVTWNQWCRALGRPESHGGTNAAIKRSLDRLRSATITVRVGQEAFRFRMVKEFWKDDNDTSWISVDPVLVKMLDCEALDSTLEHRTALVSQLARWLHAYCVCGTRKTETMDIDKLRVMCGAEHYPRHVFKDRLKKAIKALTVEIKVEGRDTAIPPVLSAQTRVEKATVHFVMSRQAIDDQISHKRLDAGVARLTHAGLEQDAPAIPFNARRRVFVVTTSSTVSDGYIDFHSRLARFGNAIDGVVRMKPAKRDQDNTRHLAGAILKLIETHNPGRNDIVAIVRGGGPDEQFTMFDAQVSIDAILALRNRGVFVIAGVGHTRHAWAIDAHVDHAAPVPFAAAEYVNRLLDLANNRPAIEPKRRIFPVRAPVQRHPAVA
ncbi:TPA: hypothetical protein QDB01_000376 [Burkholderia vietnamiensis]|nr:hypothetical protein [Burkholderia vietnamiensis]